MVIALRDGNDNPNDKVGYEGVDHDSGGSVEEVERVTSITL